MISFLYNTLSSRPSSGRIVFASIFLALSYLTLGCSGSDYRPEAVGKEGEITVVIDSTQWQGPVGEALRSQLGVYIQTLPAPEREFVLRPTRLGNNFDIIRQQKNVIFAAPLSDTTAVARFIRARLGEGSEEALDRIGGVVVPKENLWRRNQMVVYMTAPDSEGLVEAIQDKGEDLRYVFNSITRERVKKTMFEKGRQVNLEDTLMTNHGFAVNVQHDYFIAIDTTNFVWLRRVLSDTERNLWVYYIENADPSILSPQWILATRDSLTKKYIQGTAGDFVSTDYRRPLETDNINFLDRYGFETRGLWYMIYQNNEGKIEQRLAMGGPFVNYTFYDETSGRIYMIDGMVFAPGYDKREFLRQMEVIAHTFRTRSEVASAAALAESRT